MKVEEREKELLSTLRYALLSYQSVCVRASIECNLNSVKHTMCGDYEQAQREDKKVKIWDSVYKDCEELLEMVVDCERDGF